MRCIGIDIGSSSIKGGVLNVATGRVEHIEKVAFPGPVNSLPSGFHEVSPAEIVQSTRQVLHSLLQAAPDAEHIRFSSQMGGVLLLNQQQMLQVQLHHLHHILAIQAILTQLQKHK